MPDAQGPPGRLRRIPSFGQALTAALLIGAAVNVSILALNPPVGMLSPGPILRLEFLCLLFVTAILPWLTYTLRMMNWLSFLDHPLGFRGTLKVAVGAEVSSVFGPSTFTSSGAKACLLLEQSTPPAVVVSLMSLIALEDFILVAACLPASLFIACPPDLRERLISHLQHLSNSNSPSGSVLGLLVAVALAFIVLVIGFARRGWALRIRRGIVDLLSIAQSVSRRGKSRLVLNLLLTLLQWACRYTFVTLIAMAFGLAVNVPLYFLLHWLVYTGANMTPTPGSAGGAEAAFFFFFGMVLPAPLLPWAALGWRFFSFYYPVLLGSLVLAYLAWKPASVRKRSNPPALVADA